MIGRAAIGNPWIFSRLDRSQVPPEMVRQMVHLHLERHMEFYGPQKGLTMFRKHAMQYLKLQNLPRPVRTKIIQQKDVQVFLSMVDDLYAGLGAP
jgi:tRNA-dihydrouridine synthase B